MNHMNQNINGKNLILKRNLEIIENTFKKYRYSVNTSDIGIKRVSKNIKEPHKQRVYAICGVSYTTRTLPEVFIGNS